MKKVVHKANTRGLADHGWLKSQHSFSFGSYYNPQKMGFGLLRVLNDDIVDPSQGFGTHPHKDMEIVSIPLSGALRHNDSEGNEKVIQQGEVQLMSAGTGVRHSEYNASDKDRVNFLQIWVMPEKLAIKPRYDQREFSPKDFANQLKIIVSPLGSNDEGIKINQNAYFSMAHLQLGKKLSYKMNDTENGVYIFIVEGEANVLDEELKKRDALGVEDILEFEIFARKNAHVLFLEVPMKDKAKD